MITYHSDDTITLRGYARRPVKLTFRAWLNYTDAAIDVCETAIQHGVKTEADATSNELLAKRWLAASFAHASKMGEAIANYKAHRHLFDLSPDPSRLVRCKCCNIVLSDPVSKLLGVGPICRTGGKRATVRVTASATVGGAQ